MILVRDVTVLSKSQQLDKFQAFVAPKLQHYVLSKFVTVVTSDNQICALKHKETDFLHNVSPLNHFTVVKVKLIQPDILNSLRQ